VKHLGVLYLTSLSFGGIDDLCSSKDFPLAEGILKRVFFDDIYRTMENFLQIQLHLHKVKQADLCFFGKGDKHIHITVGVKIIT
jgi:hypothetical protein